MAPKVCRPVAVQADVAGLRANRRIADDNILDTIFGQVAVEQPGIERIGFERILSLYEV